MFFLPSILHGSEDDSQAPCMVEFGFSNFRGITGSLPSKFYVHWVTCLSNLISPYQDGFKENDEESEHAILFNRCFVQEATFELSPDAVVLPYFVPVLGLYLQLI